MSSFDETVEKKLSKLASWKQGYYGHTLEKGDYLARVWGDANEDHWRWEIFDPNMKVIRQGIDTSIEGAEKKAEGALNQVAR
jgi:hypothetical protein